MKKYNKPSIDIFELELGENILDTSSESAGGDRFEDPAEDEW